MKRSSILIFLILFVVIVDQALKVYIKLNYNLQGGFNILGLDWAKIYFIENDGMAFGLSFGGKLGKYMLSIFRIFLVGFLIYFLKLIINSKESFGLQISFALIIAGALGNIIDSAFYGMIFSESPYHSGAATFLPEGGGYAGFLQGKVVDMFYFPMIRSTFPNWFPFWGGEQFLFFRPVFNVADSAISIGVAIILIFYRSFFMSDKKKTESESANTIVKQEDMS